MSTRQESAGFNEVGSTPGDTARWAGGGGWIISSRCPVPARTIHEKGRLPDTETNREPSASLLVTSPTSFVGAQTRVTAAWHRLLPGCEVQARESAGRRRDAGPELSAPVRKVRAPAAVLGGPRAAGDAPSRRCKTTRPGGPRRRGQAGRTTARYEPAEFSVCVCASVPFPGARRPVRWRPRKSGGRPARAQPGALRPTWRAGAQRARGAASPAGRLRARALPRSRYSSCIGADSARSPCSLLRSTPH